VPVTYDEGHIYGQLAQRAVDSDLFVNWVERCERPSPDGRRRIEIRSVELQGVDLFGSR